MEDHLPTDGFNEFLLPASITSSCLQCSSTKDTIKSKINLVPGRDEDNYVNMTPFNRFKALNSKQTFDPMMSMRFEEELFERTASLSKFEVRERSASKTSTESTVKVIIKRGPSKQPGARVEARTEAKKIVEVASESNVVSNTLNDSFTKKKSILKLSRSFTRRGSDSFNSQTNS